jgi:hypothetical protein
MCGRPAYFAGMRNIPTLLAGGLLALAAFSQPVLAAEAKTLGSFSSWDAFMQAEGRNRTCYLVGRPKTVEPKGVKRDDIYLTVTHRSADKVRNEVGVFVGYPLKDKSTVDAEVGKTRFSLFVRDDAAWAVDAKTDKALTDALATGQSLVVKGTSARGTATIDTYVLQGFAAALKAINTACPP